MEFRDMSDFGEYEITYGGEADGMKATGIGAAELGKMIQSPAFPIQRIEKIRENGRACRKRVEIIKQDGRKRFRVHHE
jgi:hypothetical protein